MESEAAIRAAAFFGMLAVMALWEWIAPRRRPAPSKASRWLANLGIVAINTLLVRLLLPAGAIGAALFAELNGWGLLYVMDWPGWLAVAVAVVLLDLAIYLQHVMFHALPLLWRLHMVHHADRDFDVSTGLRFHPLEILLSMVIKMAVVLLIGAPMAAVLIFEVLLNATAMFNHGNVRLPLKLDRRLRWIVVTPDMHRVHHSVLRHETNSNYGFNLPWWDRLCGTYRAQPRMGHAAMDIGLAQFPVAKGLGWMLALPFTGGPGGYPINRSD